MGNTDVTDVDFKDLKVQKWRVIHEWGGGEVLEYSKCQRQEETVQLWGDDRRLPREGGTGAEPKRWVGLVHVAKEERPSG